MRFVLSVVVALGAGLLLGGLLCFVYGATVVEAPIRVSGLGRLDGVWSRDDYCFAGSIQAAVGLALVTFGVLNRRARGAA